MLGGFSLFLCLDAYIKLTKCRIVWSEAVLRIRIQCGPWLDPDPESKSGFVSRRAKMTHKNIKSY
jgi:hypothetical protein